MLLTFMMFTPDANTCYGPFQRPTNRAVTKAFREIIEKADAPFG